jgi:hypothetical protein
MKGTTIGPLVKLLKIKKKEDGMPTIKAIMCNDLMDNVMISVEAIAGVSGQRVIRKK